MAAHKNQSATPLLEGYGQLSPLAAGAFSVVYRAVAQSSGREVAIKILNGALPTEADRIAFQREVEAMTSLGGHPNIVELLDSNRTDSDRPYLVMPLYHRGTFGALVDAHGPLKWPEVLTFGVKASGAVESVHRRGFVHRDIKPANIFLGDDESDPVLADFGVSSYVAPSLDGPSTVAISATPIFAAPEVLNGDRPSTVSDIYSLGTVLYGLAEGRPAYAHQSPDRVIRDVTSNGDVPIIGNQAPPDFVALVAKMMAKNPTERPTSMLGVAKALARIQYEHGLPATSILVLTDDALADYSSHVQSVGLVDEHDKRNVVHTDGTSSRTATNGQSEGSGWQTGRSEEATVPPSQSLSSSDTVIVEPIGPPTEVLARSPKSPNIHGRVRPGWRWPIIIGVSTLLSLLAYWLLTGQLLNAGVNEADNDTELSTLVPTQIAAWQGHQGLVGRVAWSPDGTMLATAGRDGHVSISEVANSVGGSDDTNIEEVANKQLPAWILDVAWSTDGSGRLALARSDGAVTVWSADGQQFDLNISTSSAEAVAWEPGGERLVIGDGTGAVRIWSIDNAEASLLNTPEPGAASVLAAAWSPDGKAFATGGKDSRIVVWDAGTGEQITVLVHNDWVRDLAWGKDGDYIASASSDPAINNWNLATGELSASAELPADPTGGLEWSHSDPFILTGTENGTVLVWSDPDSPPTIVSDLAVPVTSVALSPDGTRWAVGRGDGLVEVWDVGTAE